MSNEITIPIKTGIKSKHILYQTDPLKKIYESYEYSMDSGFENYLKYKKENPKKRLPDYIETIIIKSYVWVIEGEKE